MDRHRHDSPGIRETRRPVRRAAILGLLFLPTLAPAGEPDRNAQQSPGRTGRLSGSVVVGPELSSRKMRFNLYPDLVQPAVAAGRPSREEELGNVVVYLEPLSPGAAAPAPPATPLTLKQEGLTFSPHVLAVQKGTTVEFPNADPIFHNVFSLSKAASFDLGRYPQGTAKSVRFDEPGVVKVFCHIHSDMSAVIIVLDNPFFVTPDSQGRFQLDGIPAGDYRAVGWHERARPQIHRVRIDAGQSAFVNFRIPLTGPASGE